MLTAIDAAQKEKDNAYKEIRHLCSLCKCPSFLSQETLNNILKLLKGDVNDKFI